MSVSTVVNKYDLPDSIDVGTPGKGGNLKVYFNASRPEETEERLKLAYAALKRARELMDEGDN